MTDGFTPGPWAVSKNSSGRRVTSTTGVVICNAVLRNTGRADRGVRHGSKDHKQAEANARLIAAAPDLLEALERFVGGKCPECKGWGEVAYFGEMVSCRCQGQYLPAPTHADVAKARAAIAKARNITGDNL